MKRETKTGDPEQLNPKELKILKLICQQHTSKEISKVLGIGVKSVEKYREHLLNKTNAENMAGLVMYAMKNKLFPDL